MKVCSDACVLGAYADVGVEGRLLDIGTGTGLLALMAAQRNPTARVDAVEIDPAAFAQATENVEASPFAKQVRVIPGRIQDVSTNGTLGGTGQPIYDRILTNPPFYTNQLRSPDAAVNRAQHTDELPFEELVAAVSRLLKPDGQWWVLLPPFEMGKLMELAETAGLTPFRRLLLRHQPNKPAFRMVAGFAFGKGAVPDETLNLYETDGQTYTPSFRALMGDFYLIF